MDKTVTARFGSIDMATFAAKLVTSHFDKVKGVRVSDRHAREDIHKGTEFFSDYFAPTALNGGQFSNLVFDEPRGAAPLDIRRSADDDKNPRKIMVQITADEKSTGKIASALRNCGGWDVQVT